MREPTAPPLARGAIDRDGDARSDDDFAAHFDADPAARILALHRGRALLAQQVDGSPPALRFLRPAESPEPQLRCSRGRLGVSTEGGQAAGTPIEARVYDADAAELIEPERARWIALRPAVPVLGDPDAALFTQALAIANWHESSPFCPRCGSSTSVVQAGWARQCDREDTLLFPRTDPAVIVLITDDDDRVLLGSNALWEQNRFSLLAGFVEPGESLEAAVVREIGEETKLPVDRVEYAASQPWPFPASLMLGFTARVASGTPPAAAAPDGVEILQLRWFTREALTEALAEIALPGETSIARWMLERWYGGPIDDPVPWTTT
ncbi:NAD(+) diphosphatase [Agromyces sp. Marseille-P2726]|uniref:NAD(+) diphosphatase n=1 Tax=Agromyces sp. Marseille-P2726 TaxID=2709132 RepID=UPI0015703E97|nr:NAD(+) diphosphatase [Agromyces sp. Marseille-P2726]